MDRIEDTRDEYSYGMRECCEHAYRQGEAVWKTKASRLDKAIENVFTILGEAAEDPNADITSLKRAINQSLDLLEDTDL